MFRTYLAERSFPVEQFLAELDKREVLFLYYLASHKDHEEIFDCVGSPDDIETFYKTSKQVIGNRLRKLPRERLEEDLRAKLEKRLPDTMIYSSVYDYHYDKDYMMFSPLLLSVERVATILFIKKIRKILDSEGKGLRMGFEELEKWFLYPDKPILNTLGLTMLLAKIDAVKDNFFDLPFIHEMRDSLILLFSKQFINIERTLRLQAEEDMRKKELRMERYDKEILKKEELFKKTKEQCQELSQKMKQIEKEAKEASKATERKTYEETAKKFEEEIRELQKQIESLNQEKEVEVEKEKEKWNEQIELITKELELSKEKEKQAITEMNVYKRKLTALESKTIETTLREYMQENELSIEIKEMLQDALFRQEREEHNQKKNEVEEPRQKPIQRIGYCEISEGKHWVVFADGQKMEIQNIPESTYIGNNQFVKVDSHGEFKYIFGYRFVPSERDFQIADFGSVIYKGNEPYMIRAIWDEQKIQNLASHIHLRDSQVISVNGKCEVIRFYGSVRQNADNYLDSIKLKGQEAYYVIKAFPNGVMVRSVETGEESFKEVDFNTYSVKEQQVMCIKDNKIVYVYYSPRFYTHSSFYKKAETGIAELQNDKLFIRKATGEIVIVNDIPPNLHISEGETLIVDEHANFIATKRVEQPNISVERKRIGMAKQSMKKPNERIEIKREVLIVGKITYENSYKMAFLKNGYRAEVIDGYDPWSRIRSSLKGKDAVVVVSEFISHDNMWRLKDEGLDVPLLFPEYDGANRILEDVEATFEANTI